MYVLEKVSYPGWQIKAEEIEFCLQIFEGAVCNHCKMTKQDYDTFLDSWWAKSDHTVNPLYDEEYEPDVFFPDNYKGMGVREKIDALLDTACGCEYDFWIEEDSNETE